LKILNTKSVKKISIIIPTLFEEELLANLLKQFSQPLKTQYDFEVIVSDGGSKDKTVEIAKQYADKVVENTSGTKQNISYGRNNGANVASGDIFVFLNADCMPDNFEIFFSEILDFANSKKNISAIACAVKAFADSEKFIDKIFYFLHNHYVYFLNILGVGMGRGECQIVRREMFEKVGGYNPHLVASEDFDLYRRITKNGGKILFSRKILINESPRRFRKYGYLKTLWYWTLNSLTVIFFNKSISKEWEPVR